MSSMGGVGKYGSGKPNASELIAAVYLVTRKHPITRPSGRRPKGGKSEEEHSVSGWPSCERCSGPAPELRSTQILAHNLAGRRSLLVPWTSEESLMLGTLRSRGCAAHASHSSRPTTAVY